MTTDSSERTEQELTELWPSHVSHGSISGFVLAARDGFIECRWHTAAQSVSVLVRVTSGSSTKREKPFSHQRFTALDQVLPDFLSYTLVAHRTPNRNAGDVIRDTIKTCREREPPLLTFLQDSGGFRAHRAFEC